MATPEELKELEKGLKKCFGDQCKVIQEQVDSLKSQLKAEEEKEIPQEWKDYTNKFTKECVGDACKENRKKIVEEDFKKAQEEWHTNYALEHAEEEKEEEKPAEYCWECSRGKAQGQFVMLGEDGCSHGN